VITAIDVDKKTGDVWLALFGGGLARFSGGRFDHWHQLNSGLVNDVVYGVAVQDEYIWAATTAGASRFNTVTGEWDDLHRKELSHGRDLELQRELPWGTGRSTWPCGAAACSSTIWRRAAGRITWTPTARWRSICIATTGLFT
jgi:frataxin-like iron-binding protein CyaY